VKAGGYPPTQLLLSQRQLRPRMVPKQRLRHGQDQRRTGLIPHPLIAVYGLGVEEHGVAVPQHVALIVMRQLQATTQYKKQFVPRMPMRTWPDRSFVPVSLLV
jgi:hypothetical protein